MKSAIRRQYLTGCRHSKLLFWSDEKRHARRLAGNKPLDDHVLEPAFAPKASPILWSLNQKCLHRSRSEARLQDEWEFAHASSRWRRRGNVECRTRNIEFRSTGHFDLRNSLF